jgi:small-conductance mechanosensitive channel
MKTSLLLVALILSCAVVLAGTPSDTTVVLKGVKVDTTVKAPVILDAETLFVVQAGIRGMTAVQRAGTIARRIEGFAEEPSLSVDSIRTVESEASSEILVEDRLLLSIFDIDAALAGRPLGDLSDQHAATIRAAVVRYRESRSQGTLLQGVLLSAAATVLLIVLLRLLSSGLRRLEEVFGSRVHGISVQEHEIIRADWLKTVLRLLIRLGRWTIVIILVYAYFQFVLSRFVWTRTIAAGLLDLTLGPLRQLGSGLVAYLPNLFFLLILALITKYIIRFLRFVFREVESGRMTFPGFYAEWAIPTFKIVRVLVVALALVVAFPYIPGSNSPAFQGISIFLGLLLSLGSTSAVANIVAGVILTYMRSFRVGDIVKIQETVGRVIGSDLLVTRIRTFKNVDVTIPNATVLSTHVVNYSVRTKEGGLILHTSVTIGYDAPWRQVHAMMLMAAERTGGILQNPTPFVLQNSLDDFYVTYELNAYTATPENMLKIYSDLHKNIQDAFNEHGVQIMSPNYIADRNKPTFVPKDHWYDPPARKPGEPGADV